MNTPVARPHIALRLGSRAGRLAHSGVRTTVRMGRLLLARALWLLRGWAGLIVGLLVAVALGPYNGWRWVATQATAAYWHVAAIVMLTYHTAYAAVAWPAADGLQALHDLRAWHYRGLVPTFHLTPWAFWMRNGGAWRYAMLQRPSAAAVRALLPLEVGGGGVLLVLLTIIVVVLRARARAGQLTPSTVHGDARLATWREIVAFRLKAGEPCVFLGLARRRFARAAVALVGEQQYVNTLLVGKMGSGKSVLIKGNLLREDGSRSVVAIDPKGELFADTAGALARRHDVYRLDFRDAARSCGWNPLAICQDYLSARQFADVWIANTGQDVKTPYWANTAALLITASVLHLNAVAAQEGRVATLPELADFLTQTDIDKVEETLKKSPGPKACEIAGQYLHNVSGNAMLRASISSEFHPRFALLNAESVRGVTGRDDIRPAALVDTTRRPTALYIALPPGRDGLFKPLTAVLFTQFFTTLLDIASMSPGSHLPRPVMLSLDELGTVGDIPGLAGILNVTRQPQIAALGAVQVIAQFRDTYGDGAEALLAAFATQIALKVNDKDAEYFSKECGQTTVLQRNASAQRDHGRGRPDRTAAAMTEVPRRLLLPDQIQRMRKREMLVLTTDMHPFKLRQQQWWRVTALRRLGKLPAPGPVPHVPTTPTPTPATVRARIAAVTAAPQAAMVTAPIAPAAVIASPTPTTTSAPSAPSATPANTTKPVKQRKSLDWTVLP
jgi:type IV secretory pathway TraG/TraD family ATPase VirD4